MQRHIHLHIEESHIHQHIEESNKNAKPEAIICMYLKSWNNGRLPLLCWQLRSRSHLVSYTLRKLRANMQHYIVTAGEQNTSRLRGRTLTSEPCTEKARWKTNQNQSLQGNTGSNLGKDRQPTDRCQHL